MRARARHPEEESSKCRNTQVAKPLPLFEGSSNIVLRRARPLSSSVRFRVSRNRASNTSLRSTRGTKARHISQAAESHRPRGASCLPRVVVVHCQNISATAAHFKDGRTKSRRSARVASARPCSSRAWLSTGMFKDHLVDRSM